MNIRPATAEDLPGIFEIYDHEVLHGIATFDTIPKSESERIDWLCSAGPRYPVLVSAAEGRIAGWARLYPWSPRQAYARTAENAVYVHPDRRGQGLGRPLMEELLRGALASGIHVVVARVVEGNPASRRLHERLGFRTIGVMRGVGEKFGRILDVRLMELQLQGTESAD